MNDFQSRDKAVEYLKAQNETRMAQLPEEIQEMLRTTDPDKAAEWLDQNASKYVRPSEESDGTMVLSDAEQRLIQAFKLDAGEFQRLYRKLYPDEYANRSVVTPQDERAAQIARDHGQRVTAEQIADRRRANDGEGADTPSKITLTQNELQMLRDLGVDVSEYFKGKGDQSNG